VSDYSLQKFPKVRTHEFTQDHKVTSVIVGTDTLAVKAADEVVLEQCDCSLGNATGEVWANLDTVLAQWGGGKNGFRCLGLADKDAPITSRGTSRARLNRSVTSAAGIVDPRRDAVPPAIAKCNGAAIRVIMCTRDNFDTAMAIGQKICLLEEDEDTHGKSAWVSSGPI
jgi:magnesium-transporting ATPase (P-type)